MIAQILQNPRVQLTLAQTIPRILPAVVTFRSTTIVTSWDGVAEVLRRDDDFRIAPVNAKRIEGVSGPFFLGMDRSQDYFAQRSAGYRALCAVDMVAEGDAIAQDAAACLTGTADEVDIIATCLRPVATRTAARVFGVPVSEFADYQDTIRAVFHETFLNLGENPAIREKGRSAGTKMSDWTLNETTRRRNADETGPDMLGHLIANMPYATADQICHVLNGYLVGSIDTTTTALAYILSEFMRDKSLLAAAHSDRNNPRRLFAWAMEALRRRPHNPIILRQTVHETTLLGKTIPAGNRVVAATIAAMQDPAVFLNPGLMDRTRQMDRYMHFGFGPHQCAGRDVNAVQFVAILKAVLDRNPARAGSITNAGPFPQSMMMTFERGRA